MIFEIIKCIAIIIAILSFLYFLIRILSRVYRFNLSRKNHAEVKKRCIKTLGYEKGIDIYEKLKNAGRIR